MQRLVSPRWIAGHLLFVALVAAFVSLGFWQLRRLEERRNLNASVEKGLAAEAVAYGPSISSGPWTPRSG